MEEIYNLHVSLIKEGSDAPLTGKNFKVKFYDKDLLEDEILGSSPLDQNGHAVISVTAKKFRSKDSPLEKHPDVYFKVFDADQEIYKSPVIQDVKLKKVSEFDSVTGMQYNLGTFLL